MSNSARYTSASFTLPTAPASDANTLYLNNFDGSSGAFGEPLTAGPYYLSADSTIQTSTDQAKFGSSSLWFENTYSSLEINAPPPGYRSAWTVEFWAYPLSVTAYGTLLGGCASATTNVGVLLQFNNTSNTLMMALSSRADGARDITGLTNSSGGLNLNAWNHVAVVFTGIVDGHYYLFVNGAKTLTVNNTTPVWRDTWRYLTLGFSGSNTTTFNGCLDELRISSVARYTTTFTPSSGAFGRTSTLLLNHFDGGVIPQFTNPQRPTRRTRPRIQTQPTVAKFGSALSLGAGIHHNALALGPLGGAGAPWTVECWAYAIGPANSILAMGYDATSVAPLGFQISYLSGALVAYPSRRPALWDIGVLGQTSVSTDAWHPWRSCSPALRMPCS